MVKPADPGLSIDEIVRRIREEVARRKSKDVASSMTEPTLFNKDNRTSNSEYFKIPMLSAEPALEAKGIYHLNDFLNYHDTHFITTAYQRVLGRHPDPSGFTHYLERLRQGKFSKVEILGRLRYSQEGRRNKVKIQGLFWSFSVHCCFRLPVIGQLLRLGVGILNLPELKRNMQVFENYTQYQYNQLQDCLAAMVEDINHQLLMIQEQKASAHALEELRQVVEQKANARALEELRQVIEQKANARALEELRQSKAERVDIEALQLSKADSSALEEHIRIFVADHDALQQLSEQKADKVVIEELKKNKAERSELDFILYKILEAKRNIWAQERRSQLLIDEVRKLSLGPVSKEQVEAVVAEADHILDAFYVSFEDRFRGRRDDIKSRLEVYLPYVRRTGAGTKARPILDIGCGRGEWLELCAEHGLVAYGIDRNRIMAHECRQRGLKVIETDAVAYLRQLESNGLGMITAFHFIEHLSRSDLVTCFEESLRILKPSGSIIFETPNPENMLVGACYFYSDMTHIRPLVPEAIKFLAEFSGFIKVDITKLHKYSDYYDVNDSDIFKEKWFYCEMDYALIGYKPSHLAPELPG